MNVKNKLTYYYYYYYVYLRSGSIAHYAKNNEDILILFKLIFDIKKIRKTLTVL